MTDYQGLVTKLNISVTNKIWSLILFFFSVHSRLDRIGRKEEHENQEEHKNQNIEQQHLKREEQKDENARENEEKSPNSFVKSKEKSISIASLPI